MRITKKYAGASSIGKKTFQPCEKTPDNIKALERAQAELAELERRFVESESLRAGRRAAASQIVEALNRHHDPYGHHQRVVPPHHRHYKQPGYRPGVSPGLSAYGGRYNSAGGGYLPERARYHDHHMMEEHWDPRMRDVETSDEETDSDHSGKVRSRADPYGYERERELYRGHPVHPSHSRRGPMGMGGGYIDDYGRAEELDYPRRPPREAMHSSHHHHHDHNIDGASSSSARSSEASQAAQETAEPDRGDGELLLTFLMSVRKQHGPKEAKQEVGAVEAPQSHPAESRHDEDDRSAHSSEGGQAHTYHSDQQPVIKKRKT